MKQTIYEANTQGPITDLPRGEMRGSLGVSYRKQEYRFVSDNVNTQGRSWNDKILGLYPVGEAEGEVDVTEGPAELPVPVLMMDEPGNLDADQEYYGADWQDIVNYANANPGTTTDEEAGPNTIHGPDEYGDGVPDNGAPILTDDFDDMSVGGFSWSWPIEQGNPNLEPETGDT